MALSESVLKGLIKSNIITCFGAPDNDPKLDCFCDAVAKAVVQHIVAAAVVIPDTFTSPSGPVTGTGKVT